MCFLKWSDFFQQADFKRKYDSMLTIVGALLKKDRLHMNFWLLSIVTTSCIDILFRGSHKSPFAQASDNGAESFLDKW